MTTTQKNTMLINILLIRISNHGTSTVGTNGKRQRIYDTKSSSICLLMSHWDLNLYPINKPLVVEKHFLLSFFKFLKKITVTVEFSGIFRVWHWECNNERRGNNRTPPTFPLGIRHRERKTAAAFEQPTSMMQLTTAPPTAEGNTYRSFPNATSLQVQYQERNIFNMLMRQIFALLAVAPFACTFTSNIGRPHLSAFFIIVRFVVAIFGAKVIKAQIKDFGGFGRLVAKDEWWLGFYEKKEGNIVGLNLLLYIY